MTRKRKTFKIKELINMANKMNEESTCSRELRLGWNVFVKGILIETGNYEGYLHAQEAFDPQTKEMIDDSRWLFLDKPFNSHRVFR